MKVRTNSPHNKNILNTFIMDSDMKLKFGHPCNNCSDMEKPIYKVRPIPLKSKSRVNLGGNHFFWEFTQWGYNFFFEHFDDGHYELVASNNPRDPYDWKEVEDFTVIKD